ncbi:hypothetical protein ABI908_05675 [Chromobacterium phragmitis]|uniref:Secreted protein n=1 Tax=Chromobacterium phragmitis TaxID=2202141 RepID=A0ABV0IQQ7_9NEIS
MPPAACTLPVAAALEALWLCELSTPSLPLPPILLPPSIGLVLMPRPASTFTSRCWLLLVLFAWVNASLPPAWMPTWPLPPLIAAP